MRDVGDELAIPALRGLEAPNRLGQRIGHPIELRRESRELVGAAGLDPGRQVTGGDAGRRGRARRDGAQDPAGHQPSHCESQHDRHEGGREEAEPELVECRLDGLGRKMK